jgi:RNA polymerase sigma-70 factor (ECF subfamily)
MGKRDFLLPQFKMSDEQAMWRVQMQDDHSAFIRLIERWEKPILRLCSRMTGDVHRGEDLKQETFVRVFARRKDYRPEARFSTWVWRIALNLCYDELRKRQRRAERSLEEQASDAQADLAGSPTEDLAPDAQATAAEESALVRQALLRLSEPHRTVLVLRYCEGLKLREIAEILELPETTVASRIAVALASITRTLEPELGQGR